MNKIQLRLFAFVFAAFLPPKNERQDDETESYYSTLGLQKSCKQEEIRKAYKKKSLQYHPDKVAQFARSNNKSPAEIQADFVKIKEAYETLSDVNKRNAYDVLGPHGGKMFNAYQDTESFVDPNQIMMNLATASFVNKTKLFILVSLLVSIVLLGPILICIKADTAFNGNEGALTDIDWVFILIPLWVLNFLFLMLSIISEAWFLTLKIICITVLEVFLALKWDGALSWDYIFVLIPLILHQLLSLVDSFVTIQNIRHDVARMVTVSYLEEKILPTFRMDAVDEPEISEAIGKRSYNDLTEEETEYINKLYVILDQGSDDMNGSRSSKRNGNNEEDVDPEVKLLFDIANSAEFKYASYRQRKAKAMVLRLLFTRLPFLVLLICQLDLNKGWDWNLVFCTIWIEVCLDTLANCFVCCCYGIDSSGEETMIIEKEVEKDAHAVADLELGGIKPASQENDHEHNISDSKEFDNTYMKQQEGKRDENKEDETKSDNGFSPVSYSSLIGKDEKIEGDGNQQDDDNIYVIEEEDNDDEDHDPEVAHRRTQAVGNCFNDIIMIIFLALFLVKLNGAYDETTNSGSYSSIWIIFPLLLFSGLILCSCGICIYARINPETLESMMGRKSQNEGSGDNEAKADVPINQTLNATNEAPIGADCDDLD